MGVDNKHLRGKAARFFRESGMHAFYELRRMAEEARKRRRKSKRTKS